MLGFLKGFYVVPSLICVLVLACGCVVDYVGNVLQKILEWLVDF